MMNINHLYDCISEEDMNVVARFRASYTLYFGGVIGVNEKWVLADLLYIGKWNPGKFEGVAVQLGYSQAQRLTKWRIS